MIEDTEEYKNENAYFYLLSIANHSNGVPEYVSNFLSLDDTDEPPLPSIQKGLSLRLRTATVVAKLWREYTRSK